MELLMTRVQHLIALGLALTCGNLFGDELRLTPRVLSEEPSPSEAADAVGVETPSIADLQQEIAELRKMIGTQDQTRSNSDRRRLGGHIESGLDENRWWASAD